jgi:hypothetical protein
MAEILSSEEMRVLCAITRRDPVVRFAKSTANRLISFGLVEPVGINLLPTLAGRDYVDSLWASCADFMPDALSRSDWTALGSLLIAAIALWRTFVTPVRTLRTSVLREIAEVRLELTALAEKIPFGVQSRERVSAAVGRGGNVEIFKREATSDADEVEGLIARLPELENLSRFQNYGDMEAKAQGVAGVRARARQLAEKYASAIAADDATRAYLRDAASARALQGQRGAAPRWTAQIGQALEGSNESAVDLQWTCWSVLAFERQVDVKITYWFIWSGW